MVRIALYTIKNINRETEQIVTGNRYIDIQSAKSIISLQAFGGATKHKADKLWGRYILFYSVDQTTYPYRVEENGQIKVSCVDTNTNKFGYLNTATNEFVEVAGMDRYRRVEYIESSGTQYIDTGYKVASENIEINTTLEFTSLLDKSIVCGSQVSNNSTFGGLLYYRTEYGGFGACMGDSYSNNTYSSVSTNTKYNIKHTANNGNGNLQINGVDHTATYTGTLITNFSWYIFFSHTGSPTTANVPVRAKMYGTSLKDNNVLVRDYAPVYDAVSNAYGMYDRAHSKFYGNNGTGAFTGSTEYLDTVVPVEYLEASGTQYIDTGYVFTNADLKIESKYRKTTTLAKNVFGVDTNGTSRQMHGHIYNKALYLGNTSVVQNVSQELNTDYSLDFSYKQSRTPKAIWHVNGTEYTYNDANGWAGASVTDFLFNTNSGDIGLHQYFLLGRIYYHRMYDNTDTLVRDYIPIRIGTTGYMLDLVEYKLYANDGTGAFAYGDDVPYSLLCPEIITTNRGDVKFTYNLLNSATVPDENFYIVSNSGDIGKPSATVTWRHSDYIQIEGGKTYYFGEINTTASLAGSAWYNENKTYISGFTATTLGDNNNFATAPSNAKYLRHSWRIDSGYNTDWEHTVVIAQSDVAVSFLPYNNNNLYADGEHKITVSGANLFDSVSNIIFGKYIAASSGVVADNIANFYCETYFEIKPNTSYVFFGEKKSDGTLSQYNRIHFYDENKTFISSAPYPVDEKGTGTSPANAKYARISCNPIYITSTPCDATRLALFNWYFGEGTAATKYKPYFSSTANITSILPSSTSYEDIQTGDVYKDWGFKVLDGTEDWEYNSTYGRVRIAITDAIKIVGQRNVFAYCSHYKFLYQNEPIADAKPGDCYFAYTSGSLYANFYIHPVEKSVDAFKSYLAEQYAKGTPVIILYPLKTPQTSSVTAQPVTLTTVGDYHISSDNVLNDRQITVKYKKVY